MMTPKPLSGKVIGFKTLDEGWTLIKLDDGNYLRLRTVPVKILKQNEPNPDGSPAYFIQTGPIAVAVLTAKEVNEMRGEKCGECGE